MTVSIDILTDQYSNVFDYNLPDEKTLEMPEYFNKIFGGISAEFIKSYQYVYLQLVFNHVNSRKLRFRTCTRLVITA